jgi:hypothetical protein
MCSQQRLLTIGFSGGDASISASETPVAADAESHPKLLFYSKTYRFIFYGQIIT